jgi:hypothetical protein
MLKRTMRAIQPAYVLTTGAEKHLCMTSILTRRVPRRRSISMLWSSVFF